ncbi:MAG TPA: hypothetical protein VHB01_09310 [Nitrosospira sp.]|nr:hypothetical protein [Nitrosospira sp.]
MFNFGTFAGGLAEGLRSGEEMQIRRKASERLAKAGEREAEAHEASMDKARFKQDKRERLRAANEEIVSAWQSEGTGLAVGNSLASTRASTPPSAVAGLSRGGLQPELPAASPLSSGFDSMPGMQSSNRVDSPDAGLMSRYRRNAGSRALADTPADEAIARRMLTGNLLEDSDELTRMANIYRKYGLMEEMTPWMNKAWEAKKKRIPDALHSLLRGDAKAARKALEKGGIRLSDDPSAIGRNDPQSPRWQLRFEDGRQQDIDLRELASRFFPSSILNAY